MKIPICSVYSHGSCLLIMKSAAAWLVVGTYCLIFRRKHFTFIGVDYQKEENRERLHKVLDYLCRIVFQFHEKHNRTMGIARKLEQKGVSDDIIAECRGLSVEVGNGWEKR